MVETSVLRIGPPEHNATSTILKNALISHFRDSESQQVDDANGITISNRYFTAQVALAELGSTPAAESRQEDGIILVFDSLQSNPDLTTNSPFDGLAQAHESAETLEQCGDLLRLCVGVHIGELSASELRGKKHEDEFSRRVLWCLDHGYEYVEADLSEDGRLKGHDERDKDGYARIVEAISGTVWSSAKMGQKKKQQLKIEREQASEQVRDVGSNYEPPSAATLGKNPFSLEDESKGAGEQPAESVYLDEAKDDEETKQRLQEREQEKIFDNLEGLMRQASQIREMSRSGQLTDDERRQRAGDAATVMMNLMSQLDFGEEDSSDEEPDTAE